MVGFVFKPNSLVCIKMLAESAIVLQSSVVITLPGLFVSIKDVVKHNMDRRYIIANFTMLV